MRLKFISTTAIFCSFVLSSFSQDINTIINVKEVQRIESVLSADSMQGRAAFTPSIDRAANFIQKEFRSTGLETPDNSGSYLQDFYITRTKFISANAVLDGKSFAVSNVVTYTSEEHLYVTNDSGYTKAFIKPGDDFGAEAVKYIQSDKSWLVMVDTSFAKFFHRMSGTRRSVSKNRRSTIFILTQMDPKQYEIEVKHESVKMKLTNVVGILPGKTKPKEYVIFSGHYDHLGIGKPDEHQDSIYNGANDDASGTTAVLLLAKYFKQADNNERTLVFVAFTAEEVGGYGSQYFSKQYDPATVVAMFNIEMIGTQSKWGTNSAYITGYEKTDMGKILEKNLQGSRFTFYPDPYTPQNLFYRSDNATLARLGVPAHTISTSKMEEEPNNEPNYHKQSDEIGTLDMQNMTEIIKSIAISSTSIVTGKDTPTRLDAMQLKNR
jgi:Peptidase family M28